MEVKNVKRLLDACAEASHIEQLLPPLPQGITPRCVRVIEQIADLSRQHGSVRVSDISEMLDVTRPGITKVLRDLDNMGYVAKSKDTVDSRVVYVTLTDEGMALYRTYVEEYHQHLTEVLSEIGDEGAIAIASAIRRVSELISNDTHRNARAFRK